MSTLLEGLAEGEKESEAAEKEAAEKEAKQEPAKELA